LRLGCLAACVAVGLAQQGHPLTGTWSGDWGTTGAQRNQVTGLMNPGPNSTPIASVVVDPTTWMVRIEADSKDAAGKAVHITAEGRVEDLGSYHRSIRGTWRQGTANGDFKITRD
jgi:hypothetical protein